MQDFVLLENAERDLKGLLAQSSRGDTVTLADNDGKPLALLVSLREVAAKRQATADWREQMEDLAKKVSAAGLVSLTTPADWLSTQQVNLNSPS